MNRLNQETSPYLLQHQHNPVHWYGWGPEAFQAAAVSNRPILLSSGYAACHWCHVMAHESFENPTIAAFMNDHFINIKLDREERPDADRLYMAALHAMGEQGGWPLTMFLTPDLKPFWGGTYFPPEPRYGRPGFLQVISAVHNLWLTDQARAEGSAKALADHLNAKATATDSPLPDTAQIHSLAETIAGACDTVRGGIKGAPKFPQAPLFNFLWQQAQSKQDAALEHIVVTTLVNISQGGIYDHLGGGLSRYSTDADWLVPHFEKMLYDNAQFISLASRAYLQTENNLLATRISETVSFLLSEMRTEAGLFTSAYDADSEGEEGKYYVWSRDEIRNILASHEVEEFCTIYGVTEEGNFEGSNILNRIQHQEPDDEDRSARLALARQELLLERRNRVPPLHDDKSLADWNGLAITALAEAALVFGQQQWLDAALDAHAAVISTFWNGNTLLHSHRKGKTKHHATAHDYAQLIEASLMLAGIAARQYTLDIAITLTRAFEQQHWSEEGAGFLLTARDANDLPANDISIQDDVTASPNAVMVRNYLRLAYMSPGRPWRSHADAILSRHLVVPLGNPFAAPSLLGAAATAQDTWQITLYGVEAPIRHTLLRHALMHTGLDAVLMHKRDDTVPPGTFTLCKGTVCSLPINQVSDIAEALRLFNPD